MTVCAAAGGRRGGTGSGSHGGLSTHPLEDSIGMVRGGHGDHDKVAVVVEVREDAPEVLGVAAEGVVVNHEVARVNAGHEERMEAGRVVRLGGTGEVTRRCVEDGLGDGEGEGVGVQTEGDGADDADQVAFHVVDLLRPLLFSEGKRYRHARAFGRREFALPL